MLECMLSAHVVVWVVSEPDGSKVMSEPHATVLYMSPHTDLHRPPPDCVQLQQAAWAYAVQARRIPAELLLDTQVYQPPDAAALARSAQAFAFFLKRGGAPSLKRLGYDVWVTMPQGLRAICSGALTAYTGRCCADFAVADLPADSQGIRSPALISFTCACLPQHCSLSCGCCRMGPASSGQHAQISSSCGHTGYEQAARSQSQKCSVCVVQRSQ